MLARLDTWLAAAAGMVMLAVAGPVAAQCCAPPPPCCAPPPPPPPPSTPCCTGGHTVNVPGVNVSVSGAVVVNAQAGAHASAGASSGGVVFIGGGSSWYVEQPQPSLIQGLNVETGAEAEVKVRAVAATRRVTRRVAIQAVCVDDRAVPHPASQVRPDREVDAAYDGELYRCLAGTRMQATLADYDGELSFDGGEAIACAKGEALYHAAGGEVTCRAQKPARDCNERSLLRRYGAGVKILTLARTETYMREEAEASAEARASAASSLSITLDGGVGGVVR